MRIMMAVAAICALTGCKKSSSRPSEARAFGLAFVEEARSGKLSADLVDDVMILRVRHAQRIHAAAKRGAPPDLLSKLWKEDPEPGLSVEAKSNLQRSRAAKGIARSLKGGCTALDDEGGKQKRIEAMTAPLPGVSDEINAELARLARDLTSAKLVRVSCDDGAAGLVLLPYRGSWQAVDIFPIHPTFTPPVPNAAPGPGPVRQNAAPAPSEGEEEK